MDGAGTATQDEILTRLAQAGRLVEDRVRPDGFYDGWTGTDVLCHLGAYAYVVGAVLGAEADGRRATTQELYGCELREDELALTDLGSPHETDSKARDAWGKGRNGRNVPG